MSSPRPPRRALDSEFDLIAAAERFPPDFSPRVVHLGNGLLVVDKPWDLHIDGQFDRFTLEHMVRGEAVAGRALPLPMEKFWLVNQLDMATSGIIVLGLGRAPTRAASSLFERRQTVKWYVAVVQGEVIDPVLVSKGIREIEGVRWSATTVAGPR